MQVELQASAEHIKRAGVAQNKLAELTVKDAKKLVEPHINVVRKNILSQLKQREIDRKKNKAGSQAVYYKLKEIDQVIKDDWPDITKSVRKTAAKDIPIAAKRGFTLVNSELGTAYRTPLVSAAFAESVDLIVKTAAKVHIKVIRAEIVQGMLANDDFARSASRIAQFFDKGKGTGTYKSPFSNAARVIRTETQLAHVRAKVALYENEGFTRVLIVNGKTGCPICAPHIGEIYRLDDGPLPIYHAHCGCSAVAYDRKPPLSKREKLPESKPIPVSRETDFQKPKRNAIQWSNAKTIEGIEKQFSEKLNIKKVDYINYKDDPAKALKDANRVGSEYARLLNSNVKLNGIVKKKGQLKKIVLENSPVVSQTEQFANGLYRSDLKEIRIATDRLPFDTVNPDIRFGKFKVSEGIESVARHEFGHHINELTGDDWSKFLNKEKLNPGTQIGKNKWFGGTSKARKIWANEVSIYAGSDIKEAYAEAFNAFTHIDYVPKSLPSKIDQFFDENIK